MQEVKLYHVVSYVAKQSQHTVAKPYGLAWHLEVSISLHFTYVDPSCKPTAAFTATER